jgi:mono/diheme cytochrome c family protein
MLKQASRATYGFLGLFLLVAFGIGYVSFSLLSGLGSNVKKTLNPTELYGTVCAVSSAQGTPVIWDLYGTPTPTPTRAPRNTASAEDIALLASATQGTPYALKVGNPAHGKVIFEGVGQCVACHARTDDAPRQVGPPLTHIGTIASYRLSGVAAEEYLRDSILHPDNYLSPGYVAGIMPRSYESKISPPEIEDVVAYLLSLK